ncbi:ABC transporter permease [Halothermothrix orenii]|nr:hypothetical protein [Halothermothrix orenii]
MFILKTDFRKDLLVLFIITVLIGTILVLTGGYITKNYFSHMVSGVIGEYGEYDLLFILSGDKENIALEQIKKVVDSTLPGSVLKAGPRVAGSSNYLLKIPEEFKKEEVYSRIYTYFSDIPGIMSKNIITEPRLSIRGFRGETLPVIRPRIEKIEGIDFLYPIGNGIDVIVKSPELVPRVKEQINRILGEYKLLEIRYPLNQHPEDMEKKKKKIIGKIKDEIDGIKVYDVTGTVSSDRVSLLNSLKQMKDFLLSYATTVIISEVEDSSRYSVGGILTARNKDGEKILLKIINNKDNRITCLVQNGSLAADKSSLKVYYHNSENGITYIGQGRINNPRQDLAEALESLNEITPRLNSFLEQSEELITHSDRIGKDLKNINEGLARVEETSRKLNKTLDEWRKEGLTVFLYDLLAVLDDIERNIGDLENIKTELITTSNQLKEIAGLIEEKLVFVPRNNLYNELNDLKNLFLKLSTTLDQNYDLISRQIDGNNSMVASIDTWQDKIKSLLKVENTLNDNVNYDDIGEIASKIEESARVIDTANIENNLTSVRDLMVELKNGQIPVIMEQLTYIQNSLPEMEDKEIVETIELIDSYLAGQVIPGDQIQLLVSGNYKNQELREEVKGIVNNPSVSFFEMESGILQPNPRGELFRILSQVKAVISTIIALIFTLLVMMLDQTLIVSVIKLNGGRGYVYSFVVGGLTFSLICLLSRINFPYLNFNIEFLIGGVIGLIMALLSGMLNPVKKEEWEAGKALGFSPAGIMHEIIIPSGKPGLLYLLNLPKMIFK